MDSGEISQLCYQVSSKCIDDSKAASDASLRSTLLYISNQAAFVGRSLDQGHVHPQSTALSASFRAYAAELEGLLHRLRPKTPDILFTAAEAELVCALLDRCQPAIQTLPALHTSSQPARNPNSQRAVIPTSPNLGYIHRPMIESWVRSRYTQPGMKRILLYGMAGVGKTQVALNFAYRILLDQHGTDVFWVHCGTRQTFENSYFSIADALDLPGRHDPKVNFLALVRDYLQRVDTSPWLMILDGIEDTATFNVTLNNTPGPDSTLSSFLPNSDKGKMLVTMHALNMPDMMGFGSLEGMKIFPMQESQALQLVRYSFQEPGDTAEMVSLISALDCVPLALAQAAAYITSRRITVSSYLVKLQEVKLPDDPSYSQVPVSVMKTWDITFKQISQFEPSAAKLLFLMSQFHYIDIPSSMLHSYVDQRHTADGEIVPCKVETRQDFNDDITLLQAYSFVATGNNQETLGSAADRASVMVAGNSRMYSMHSLVQYLTRASILTSDEPQRWRRLFTRLAAHQFPISTVETWTSCCNILSHVMPILANTTVTGEREILIYSELLMHVSKYMTCIGDHSQARRLQDEAKGAKIQILGTSHLTLEAVAGSGDDCRGQRAVALETMLLYARETSLGLLHPRTLASMSELATIHRSHGRTKEADALEIRIIRLLETHSTWTCPPDTLPVMASIASNWKCHGEKAGSLLPMMVKLASECWYQSQWEAWEALELGIIHIRAAALGCAHPDTLTSMSSLADTYMKQGRCEESLKLQQKVVQVLAAENDHSHPQVLAAKITLASMYYIQGNLFPVGYLIADVAKYFEAGFGLDDPETLRTYNALANLYWALGLFDESQKIRSKTLTALKAPLGASHPDTLTCMAGLASACVEGQWTEAEEL